MMRVADPLLPKGLLVALERACRNLKYTRPQTVYHCVEPDCRNIFVGVFGDGDNGAYEWFIWDEALALRTSDCGFGCVGVALCRGLVESGAHTANGDHDLFLTWGRTPAALSESLNPQGQVGPTKKGEPRMDRQ